MQSRARKLSASVSTMTSSSRSTTDTTVVPDWIRRPETPSTTVGRAGSVLARTRTSPSPARRASNAAERAAGVAPTTMRLHIMGCPGR